MKPELVEKMSHDGWFLDRLEWEKENNPRLLEKLFLNPPKLKEYLSRKVYQANMLAHRLAMGGQGNQEALDRAFEEVICPPGPENPPEPPLSPELEKKIDDWIESMFDPDRKA